jgi:competence protein ComEC
VGWINLILLFLASVFLPPSLAESIPQPLIVHFLDVGYGDAIVLRLPEGGTILVDAGGPEQGPKVSATLAKMGIKQLDHLVITHFHKDHAGGLDSIFKEFLPDYLLAEANGSDRILISVLPKTVEPEVEAIKTEVERRPYRIVRRGEKIQVSPSVKFEVLNPKILKDDPNEDSLVIKITHGRVSFLLGSDVGLGAQKELLQEYGSQLKADLIKIPHHAGEAVEAFIQAVRPQDAILSVGPNPYGSPNSEVLKMYRKAGARIHRTDEVGTITAVSDGHSLKVLQGLQP